MKKETLEEAAVIRYGSDQYLWAKQRDGFVEGAKWQQQQGYSEEDLREAFKQSRQAFIFEKDMPCVYNSFEEWFEQLKKK